MNRVCFDRKSLTIKVRVGNSRYEIDLAVCDGSAEVLDWILKLRSLQDYSPELLHEFLDCLDEACCTVHGESANAVFCPGGVDQVVKWRKRTHERRAVER